MADMKELQEELRLANDALDALSEARQKDTDCYRKQLSDLSLEKERAVLECEQLMETLRKERFDSASRLAAMGILKTDLEAMTEERNRQREEVMR